MNLVRALLTITLTAAVLGIVALLAPDRGAPRPADAAAESRPPDVERPAPVVVPGGPIRLRYDLLGIDAAVEEFVAPRDGAALPAPDGPGQVGWYRAISGSSEGEHGLLVGHVSWHDGSEAVFAQLADARPGDTFELAEGQAGRRYRVMDVRQVDAFTTSLDAVLGSGAQPTVTLITCGGEYLWDAGAYSERTVVLAVQVDVAVARRPAAP